MGDLTQLQKDDFYLNYPIHNNISRRIGQSSGTFSSPNTTTFDIIFLSSCPQYFADCWIASPNASFVILFIRPCYFKFILTLKK